MNEFGLKFHHLGLATQHEHSAITFLTAMGYHIDEACYDSEQKVNVRMCLADDQPNVELITRADEDGPLNNILNTTTALIYHTCYTTEHPDRSLAAIKNAGLRIVPVSAPKPATLFGNKNVSFHMIKGVGLVEIIHG